MDKVLITTAFLTAVFLAVMVIVDDFGSFLDSLWEESVDHSSSNSPWRLYAKKSLEQRLAEECDDSFEVGFSRVKVAEQELSVLKGWGIQKTVELEIARQELIEDRQILFFNEVAKRIAGAGLLLMDKTKGITPENAIAAEFELRFDND